MTIGQLVIFKYSSLVSVDKMMKVKAVLLLILATMCVVMVFPLSSTIYEVESTGGPSSFTIEGLVENPLTISYDELKSFPILSEVTMLECVGSGQGGWSVTYNWAGVPIYYLLSLAKVTPGAYREVIFNATDGFSSSVPLEIAMHPTAILAFEANETDLENISGLGSGYRVVFPCRWGYKWVKWIKQIIIVDYDYLGTYERMGFSDEAIRPNCTIPYTSPPIQTFNATVEYPVQALSNSTIESFTFRHDNQLVFNISGSEEANGYFYVKFPKELLRKPYQVYVEQNLVDYFQTDGGNHSYLYFSYAQNTHTIVIEGKMKYPYDITILDVKTSKTAIEPGSRLDVKITIENQGDYTETVNITTYADTTSINQTHRTLIRGNHTIIVFTWNTTGFAMEHYTISAYASPIPGEVYTVDNNLTDGVVALTISGDVDGDFDVDIYDIVEICTCYGAQEGDPEYIANCDLDGDEDVDIYDVVIMCNHYGESHP